MKKFRIGLIVVAVIVVIGELIIIDYSNLTWSKKNGFISCNNWNDIDNFQPNFIN